MQPWQSLEKQQKLCQTFFLSSFIWLFFGGSCIALIALQQASPFLYTILAPLSFNQPHLHAGNTLFFGWLYITFVSLWLNRTLTLRGKASLTFFPIIETGIWLWQSSLLLGIGFAWAGLHNDVPILSWASIVYGLMLISSILLTLGIMFNLPKRFTPSPSVLLMLLGFFSIPILLCAHLLFPVFIKIYLGSFVQIYLQFSFLFLALSLVIDHLPSSSKRMERFYWLYPLLLSLCTPIYSSASPQSILSFFSLLALASTLFFFSKECVSLDDIDHAEPQKRNNNKAIPEFQTKILADPFLFAGILCFMVATLASFFFTILRIQGFSPSPTWQYSQGLLYGTCIFLWIQRTLFRMFNSTQEATIDVTWLHPCVLTLFAVFLFTIGSWIEAMLHLHIEQFNLQRGFPFPTFARSLQFFGISAGMFVIIQFIKRFVPLIRSSHNSHIFE